MTSGGVGTDEGEGSGGGTVEAIQGSDFAEELRSLLAELREGRIRLTAPAEARLARRVVAAMAAFDAAAYILGDDAGFDRLTNGSIDAGRGSTGGPP